MYALNSFPQDENISKGTILNHFCNFPIYKPNYIVCLNSFPQDENISKGTILNYIYIFPIYKPIYSVCFKFISTR